ncbi:hypothetical protein J6590_031006 [Homalodisca vitripennis]|nr:hypothetical protein J6590_031006 [Homalodisca vitripennis]
MDGRHETIRILLVIDTRVTSELPVLRLKDTGKTLPVIDSSHGTGGMRLAGIVTVLGTRCW